ncbi:MAG: Ni,Fe-hydrogenase III large subunit [Betaproteobacteria bacterium]|nr:MAG: Ni,Fe-hydrogenase III large subunit [Betaproteobacteria bacterium]
MTDFPLQAQSIAGAMPARRASIEPARLRSACEAARANKERLVALWGSDETTRGGGYALHLAFAQRAGLLWLSVPLPPEHPRYPGIADLFPSANRMQRAAYDLVGIHAQDNPDHRKWLRHRAWPGGVFPLRKGFDSASRFPPSDDRYPFVKVEGEGVHEIPVGPVHAGTIEPGHFRFSIVGEKILRLEERLGYKHKGIEKRFEAMTLEDGARLAGRVSGDSTVAFAWAYAMAVESASGTEAPRRALQLRALLLEIERIANHLGDLGYLGNDVALSFGFFQFWRLKEDLLRLSAALFGHRYLMDLVVPGGVARDLPQGGAERLLERLEAIRSEAATLRSIYDEHAGAQDRFIMTGQVTPDLAEKLGLCGMAGRASGIWRDLRVDYPVQPYQQMEVRMATHTRGDVAARASVRFDELVESVRLIQALVPRLSPGEIRVPLAAAPSGSCGVGWIEGWRGDVLVALETAQGNRIHRLHPHDPSWQNWPVLERAVTGNIVPDFPLINKSFNLSYSGHDL